jgi:hypothetical protein
MEALLPFAALIGASGAFLLTSRANKRSEQYQDVIKPIVADSMNPDHIRFVRSTSSRFNPISNLINPGRNTLLETGYTPTDLKTMESGLQNEALGYASTEPIDGKFKIRYRPNKEISLNDQSSGVESLVKVCEAVKTLNCDAFDNNEFKSNCGMCHEGGVSSTGSRTGGGLFITQDDKEAAIAFQTQAGDPRPRYTPSVGQCAVERLTTTKKECTKLKNQMACMKSQSFDIPGCSQCYGTEAYTYVDPETPLADTSLFLAGSGSVVITNTSNPSVGSIELILRRDAQDIELPALAEGNLVEISVTGNKCAISGYLSGKTATGAFTMDISRLIQKDLESNAAPNIMNYATLNGNSVNEMMPARTKIKMRLLMLNPFTFVSPEQEEVAKCTSAPFISKQSSAQFLASGLCYKKNPDGTPQGPGTYSTECVQALFLGAGCTARGDAYPMNASTKAALMKDSSGKALTIGEIADRVYKASVKAYTGTNEDGSEIPMMDWDYFSQWCTGQKMISPCSPEGDGPHGGPCLAYLWLNKGATDNVPGGEGPTYTSPVKSSSLFDDMNNRFCTANGAMSPIRPDGTYNQAVIDAWNTSQSTDVATIKNIMDRFHKNANDNTKSDEVRSQWMNACYGFELAGQPTATVAALQGKVTRKPAIVYQVIPHWQYMANTTNQKDGTNFLTDRRVSCPPGTKVTYYFTYNTPADIVSTAYTYAGGYCNIYLNGELMKSSRDVFPTPLTLTSGDNKIKVEVTTYQQGGGLAILCKQGTTANGTVLWSTSSTGWEVDADLENVIDSKPGRTKTPFTNKLNYVFPGGYATDTVTVIGPFGIGPWLKNWGGPWNQNISQFPGDERCKWIWPVNPASENSSSGWRTVYKMVVNENEHSIDAWIYICIDYWAICTVNGVRITDVKGAYNHIRVSFPPGESMVEFGVHAWTRNTNGSLSPGFCCICYSDWYGILFRSDDSWKTLKSLNTAESTARKNRLGY